VIKRYYNIEFRINLYIIKYIEYLPDKRNRVLILYGNIIKVTIVDINTNTFPGLFSDKD